MSDIGILILDDNKESREALHHLLDSEGWLVHVASDAREALNALTAGTWNLVIANVERALPGSQAFAILRDLAHAEGVTTATDAAGSLHDRGMKSVAKAPQKKRLRVLFVVPANLASEVVPSLERDELPYSVRPYHLHEFFEKIGDLLVEAGAIERVGSGSRFDSPLSEPGRFHRAAKNSKGSSMFASRADYQMSEEEITEYERQEESERRKKTKKTEEPSSW